jgi:hypothetical protein
MFSLSTSSTVLFKTKIYDQLEKKKKYVHAITSVDVVHPSGKIHPLGLSPSTIAGYEQMKRNACTVNYCSGDKNLTYLNCKTMTWLHGTRLVIYCRISTFQIVFFKLGRQHTMMEDPRFRVEHSSYAMTSKL